MSFDEEDDHYMSKADFAMMCDEIKNLKQQRDELLVAAKAIRPFIEDDAVPRQFWAAPFIHAVDAFDAAIAKAIA